MMDVMTTTLRTKDGQWTVEVLRVRGRESFRVRRPLDVAGPSPMNPPGQIVQTVAEVRAIMGDEAFETLAEVRRRL